MAAVLLVVVSDLVVPGEGIVVLVVAGGRGGRRAGREQTEGEQRRGEAPQGDEMESLHLPTVRAAAQASVKRVLGSCWERVAPVAGSAG